MKIISVDDFRVRLDELLNTENSEVLLVARDAKPLGLWRSMSEFYDEEDLGYMTDPEFWKMIQERRSENGVSIPWEEAKRRLFERQEESHLRDWQAASEPSLREVWDNDSDAAYDQL